MIGTLLLLTACGGSAPESGEVAAVAAVLPDDGDAFAPSLLRSALDGGEGTAGQRLADVATCAGCHPDQGAEWADSAHGHASFDNPWYRAAVDSFRDARGAETSRMCAGCHDPALLVDGAMDEAVSPDDPRAHAGVACLACHGTTPTVQGNGSLALHGGPVPPDRDDVDAVAEHRAAMARGTEDGTLCVSCHRGFLSDATGHTAQLFGMDEGGAWAASPWAGSHAGLLDEPVPERGCIDCHMAETAASPGRHRFPGGQTALAAQLSPDAERAAVDLLQDAVQVYVAAVWIDGRPVAPAAAQVGPGDALVVDVVVRNTGVGHAFPGGLKDTQATTLQLALWDGGRRTVAEGRPWRLGAVVVDAAGQPEWSHRPERFGAEIADATVPAGGARAVRWEGVVPEDAVPPLSLHASVVHTRHVPEMGAVACAAEDGAWTAASRAPLTGCAAPVVHELARHDAPLGGGASSWAPLAWDASFALALARSGDVTEALPLARESLALLSPETPLQQAQVHWLRGRIAARQGRVDEALAEVAAAEALIGAHPALDRVRVDALARVWRWEEAPAPAVAVTEAAPRDTQAWRDLAAVTGSLGDAEASLAAAQRGMQGAPRDPALLRHQALALEALALDAPGLSSAEATQAWVDARAPDVAHDLEAACARQAPGCDDWRRPVPTLGIDPR